MAKAKLPWKIGIAYQELKNGIVKKTGVVEVQNRTVPRGKFETIDLIFEGLGYLVNGEYTDEAKRKFAKTKLYRIKWLSTDVIWEQTVVDTEDPEFQERLNPTKEEVADEEVTELPEEDTPK